MAEVQRLPIVFIANIEIILILNMYKGLHFNSKIASHSFPYIEFSLLFCSRGTA